MTGAPTAPATLKPVKCMKSRRLWRGSFGIGGLLAPTIRARRERFKRLFARKLGAMRSRQFAAAVVPLVGVAGLWVAVHGQTQPQQPAPAAAAAAPAAPVILSPGSAAARMPKTADEFDTYFHQVKNWGRWGAADELGAANLITDAKRKQAASLVRTGRAVGLAHSPLTVKDVDNASPFEHTMNKGFSTDTYRVSYHGYAHSHLDALCHILYKDQTYNGYARADVNVETGCTKLGIQSFRHGYVTRGVLMDLARLKDVAYLEPGTPLFVEDLEAWEKRAGVKVSPGDAVLIRTGRWARRAALGPWPVGQNAAGLHASTAAWLKARGVALIGSDAALDVVPSLVTGINLPVHTLAITALGINILDNQDLEALGELAAAQKRWEFMLTVAPVPVLGGTGFPVNALATF
jgi:kynurenine formamidase